MLPEARRLRIIDILSEAGNGVVSIGDLAHALGVSEMTVRRDLDWLEQRAILTRVHGGAVAYQKSSSLSADEKPFGDRLQEFNPQKKTIGWAAAQLVKDGARIILDAGTTTQQVARNLVERSGLTVITNNIPISTELSRYPHIETILLGGTLKHQELCTVGPMVKQGVSVLSVDTLFLSTAGFSARNGCTDPDMREVEVKQAMMHAANRIVLVADSSKYGQAMLVRTCRLDAIHTVVTDDAISTAAIAEIEAEGVEVLTPDRIARRAVQSSNGPGDPHALFSRD